MHFCQLKAVSRNNMARDLLEIKEGLYFKVLVIFVMA